jgi:hypothetical protein
MSKNRPRVNRKLLQQALQRGQQLSQRAISGQGFDPRGGVGVALAQIATAGIGAFAQNRARKQLAELEQQEQQTFARQFPQLGELAGQLSPETRQALILKRVSSQFETPTPLSPEGKKAADIRAGFLPEGTPLAETEDLEKKKERVFKQTSNLRKEFTKNSGEFIKQRDAFGRVQASAQDPSAAGDLALIFNFMKVLDPGSTVREGEFATAQNSGSIPSRVVAQYNKVLEGQRLADDQRDDFVNRSEKLFNKALTTQKRRVDQFRGIARRNQLPEEDVILDLIGSDPNKAEAIATVESVDPEEPQIVTPEQTQQITEEDRQAALEELERRRLQRQNINVANNGGV